MTDKKESKSKQIQLKGVFEWARVFEENRDKTGPNGAYESSDGACVMDVLVDEDNLKILEESGSQKSKRPKEKGPDENGLYRIKLARKWNAPYTYGGAPQVAHADGSPWSIEDDGLIGNGSSGIVYITVYDGKGLVGTRLDGVQVLEHVVYESDAEYVPGVKFVDHSGDTPKETTKPQAKTTPKDLDDEIPF